MKYTAKKRVTGLVDGKLKTFELGETVEGLLSGDISQMIAAGLVKAEPAPEDLPDLEAVYWPEERIRAAKKKAELLDYASLIGLEGLSVEMKLPEIADALVDYIANIQEGEDDGDA